MYKRQGIDCVIGGMHLMHAYEEQERRQMLCSSVAERLRQRNSQYYTCHCTSVEAYEMLHKDMGDQIRYLAAGSIIEI